MALIGLENVHYAKLTKDDSTGVTYETPKKLSGAISINENAESNTAELYADNRLWATATVFSEGNVELELADLSLEDYAALGGHSIAVDGKLIENANDKVTASGNPSGIATTMIDTHNIIIFNILSEISFLGFVKD